MKGTNLGLLAAGPSCEADPLLLLGFDLNFGLVRKSLLSVVEVQAPPQALLQQSVHSVERLTVPVTL